MLVDVKEFCARLRVAIADTSGPWEIHFRGKRKLCTNETTVRALKEWSCETCNMDCAGECDAPIYSHFDY